MSKDNASLQTLDPQPVLTPALQSVDDQVQLYCDTLWRDIIDAIADSLGYSNALQKAKFRNSFDPAQNINNIFLVIPGCYEGLRQRNQQVDSKIFLKVLVGLVTKIKEKVPHAFSGCEGLRLGGAEALGLQVATSFHAQDIIRRVQLYLVGVVTALYLESKMQDANASQIVLREAQVQNEYLVDMNKVLEGENEALKVRIFSLEQKVTTLQSELERERTEASKVNRSYERVNEKYRELRAEIEEHVQAQQPHEQEWAQLFWQNFQHNQRVSVLAKATIAMQEQAIFGLSSKLTEAEAKNAQLEARIKALEAQQQEVSNSKKRDRDDVAIVDVRDSLLAVPEIDAPSTKVSRIESGRRYSFGSPFAQNSRASDASKETIASPGSLLSPISPK